MRAPVVAGINVGGTTTSVVAGDEDGTVHARRAWPTDAARGAEPLVAEIVAAIRAIAPHARCAGVAIGGPLDARRGVVLSPPHLPGFVSYPLRERLSVALGIPVTVHHDAAACALAEWRWGACAGADGLAYLTCGTGFGVGLVLDGTVRYGRDGHSPEIGHVRFRDDGPSIFGKPGCYEGYGSANAIALLARERDERFARATPAEVVAAAEAGDTVARAALDAHVAGVGSACALLADLLVLDAIVLGSLARYLGTAWIDAVRAVVAREALPANVATLQLLAPSFDDVQDRSGIAAALSPCPSR